MYKKCNASFCTDNQSVLVFLQPVLAAPCWPNNILHVFGTFVLASFFLTPSFYNEMLCTHHSGAINHKNSTVCHSACYWPGMHPAASVHDPCQAASPKSFSSILHVTFSDLQWVACRRRLNGVRIANNLICGVRKKKKSK